MTIGDGSSGLPERTIGGFDAPARAWVLGVGGIGGAVLGVALPLVSGWAAGLPWVPFQGPLAWLGSFDQAWLTWGRPAIGAAVGLLLGAWIIEESPVLHVSGERIRVQRGSRVERVIERAKVDGVYRRRSKLVIESAAGRTLFEGDVEGDRTAIRDAFVSNGYPWEGPRD